MKHSETKEVLTCPISDDTAEADVLRIVGSAVRNNTLFNLQTLNGELVTILPNHYDFIAVITDDQEPV